MSETVTFEMDDTGNKAKEFSFEELHVLFLRDSAWVGNTPNNKRRCKGSPADVIAKLYHATHERGPDDVTVGEIREALKEFNEATGGYLHHVKFMADGGFIRNSKNRDLVSFSNRDNILSAIESLKPKPERDELQETILAILDKLNLAVPMMYPELRELFARAERLAEKAK